ncbi:C2H2-type domain-containing protein [Mycena kentingensis (nom. inval.)]|nr:C2H2-type domain-containing protein [Mycena kentingensis (nom. inval.)]
MTDDYTPSILIEPPSESNPELSSVGSSSESSSECYPQPPALFIQQSDSLSISTQFEHYLQADKFRLSPSTSGRSSPVGTWSPASTFSGEVFPDDFTHEEYSWSLSSHSSPAHSPSSLSPLFDGFGLADDTDPASTEVSVLNGPPVFSRLRSSSHSGPASTELWADSGIGRGRSSSFSGATDSQFLPVPSAFADLSGVSISMANADVGNFSDSLGTGVSWGAPETSPQLGSLASGWRYPGRDGPTIDTQELSPVPPSPSLLTVPSAAGLRRRGAVSSRRTLSHSDIPALEQDLGRGRGVHRTTLSIPNSRSASNYSAYSHSRSPSRDSSYGSSSDYGYSPTMPPSPALEDAERDAPISIGRRRTFAAVSEPRDELAASTASLSRAISAPSGSRSRRSRAPAVPSAVTERLGMFKADQQTDPNAFLFPEGAGSEHAEFRVSQPATTPFKAEVASSKIRQASHARRLNAATFECPLPTCNSTFTARHNLINHINSHNKHRPHKCSCGMSFTTQGVLNRHKKRCSK